MIKHGVIPMAQHRVTYEVLPPDVDDVNTHLCLFLFYPQTGGIVETYKAVKVL